MKIISVRKGFASDHSSTSYEFLAIDRPLDRKARAAVSSLSSRAAPTSRRVSFVYHADGYDIPGGWKPLMRDYYDVMYSESYGWWFLALAFQLPPDQQDEIMKYSFDGIEDMGIGISFHGERAIVAISCRLAHFDLFYDDEPWGTFPEEDGYDKDSFDDDDDCDDIDDNDDDNLSNGAEDDHVVGTGDPLLLLLVKIRKQLMEGDYRALYEVWKKYGFSEDEDEKGEQLKPPVTKEKMAGEEVIAEFAEMLDDA